MRIGIITDIHSNIQALKAVLNEFDKEIVDTILCSGDIIGIGINPEETVQELIKRKNMLIAVSGNHEQYIMKGLPKNVHNDTRKMSHEEIENHEWNHNKLSNKSKDFIKRLELSKIIKIEGKKIYIVHYPLNNDGTYKKHIKKTSIKENIEMFKEIDADVFLYGHTHTYSVNKKDGKWYINTGALGCPMGSNIAKAGILEISEGNIEFKPINVIYDVNEIIEEINNLKFPFYKKILQIFYGYNS